MNRGENRSPQRHRGTEVFNAALVHVFNGDNGNGFFCASVSLWLMVGMPT